MLRGRLEDYVCEDNPVRLVEAFVEKLDMGACGFARAIPRERGRLAYAAKGAD